jgi:hypothetical protein
MNFSYSVSPKSLSQLSLSGGNCFGGHKACVIADILKAYGCEDDRRAGVSAAGMLLVAVVAAKYFQNHHERDLCILIRLGDIPHLSVSRFNRRLHALSDWLYDIVTLLGEIFAHGEAFIIDSMPLPVCKRARRDATKKCVAKPRIYENAMFKAGTSPHQPL